MRAGSFLSAHGVIGNTTEFGSVIGGSSPSVLTNHSHVKKIIKKTQLPLLVKVGVFFFKTIMIDVKDIISRLQQAKIDNKQEPAIVSMVEVQQEALKMTLEELRRMTREGEINYHQTLNGHAFSIKL